MRALDEAATAKLVHAAADTRLSIPVMLAVTTGLRRGEILALRWQNVDLENGSLAVRQSLERTRSGLTFGNRRPRRDGVWSHCRRSLSNT
jgi:integrase